MVIALVLLVFFALHQDIWLWRASRPLVFGVLPLGLAYHAAYTLAVSIVMAILVRRAWPAHLETPDAANAVPPDDAASGPGRGGA
jgi:Protein of unknown function (DUF3311)